MISCGSCRYSVALEGEPYLMDCRRRSVQLVGLDEYGTAVSAFPTCEPDMWCGDYRPEDPVTRNRARLAVAHRDTS